MMIHFMLCILMTVGYSKNYASDHPKDNKIPKLTKLTNGLLTKIPRIFLQEIRHDHIFYVTPEIIIQKGNSISLAEAIATQYVPINSRNIMYKPSHVFYPVIVEITSEGHLIDHGIFKTLTHVNAVECLRRGQGAFYSYKQGVIIYWNEDEQDIINRVEQKKEHLELIAEGNFPKELFCDNFPLIFNSEFMSQKSKL